VQRIFTEMQPLHAFLLTPPYTVALAYAVAALVGLTVVLRFRQYRLWEVALLLGLAVLANVAFRSLQDWLLVMLALGVPHLARLPRQIALQRRRLARDVRWVGIASGPSRFVLRADRSCKRILSSPLLRGQWVWPGAAVGVLAVLSLIPGVSRSMPVQDAKEWPAAALDWMAAHDIHGRFFGPPDYGSYVTWRLGDRARCYADTRGFFFSAELLEDSHYLPQRCPDWRPRLRRVLDCGTDYFLLETTGPRAALWQALQPVVEEPLYRDDQAVLLSREQVERAVARLGDAPPSALASGGPR
jgi:hypothetical protein